MTVYYLHALAADYFNFCIKKSNLLNNVLTKLLYEQEDIERTIYVRVWCTALGMTFVEEELDEQYIIAWDAEIMEIVYTSINQMIEEHSEIINREEIYKKVEYAFRLSKEIDTTWSEDDILMYYMKVESLLLHKKIYDEEKPVIEFIENIDFNIILSNYWRNFFQELDGFLKNRTIIN